MRGLLVYNPTATRMKSKHVTAVTQQLRGVVDLQVAATKGRGHASYLAAGAVHEGLDVVFAYGGDGTVNEVLQALAHTDVPLGVIPGGSTNVLARTLGLPLTPQEATTSLLDAIARERTRAINLGKANDRWFAFCAGLGFDAAVARRVERRWRVRPTLLLQVVFAWLGLVTLFSGYDRRGTDITVAVPGREPLWSMRTVACCNSDPYTYLGKRPARLCPGAQLDGDLDVTVTDDLRIRSVLRLVSAALRSKDVGALRGVHLLHDQTRIECTSRTELPWQVDGDYIGMTRTLVLESCPRAVRVLV